MVKEWMPESGYEVEEPMVPHGLATVVTAPASFRFTAPVAPEKHARIAELLGAQVEGLSARDAAAKLPDVIIALMKDVGCPNGLSAMGYTKEDIPTMVEGGWKQQRLLIGAPRQVTKTDLAEILSQSLTLW
jgi:alcohol dehydrogenase class IV